MIQWYVRTNKKIIINNNRQAGKEKKKNTAFCTEQKRGPPNRGCDTNKYAIKQGSAYNMRVQNKYVCTSEH